MVFFFASLREKVGLSFPKRPGIHADGSTIATVGAVMVLPRAGDIDGRALAVLWQETLAHGGTALEGEAQLASITEAVDNIVAVDGALCSNNSSSTSSDLSCGNIWGGGRL